MSKWYEPKLEDIDVTEDGKELHAYLDSDESGNIYVSLKVKDIRKVMNNKNL